MIKLKQAHVETTPLCVTSSIHVTFNGNEVTDRCRFARIRNGFNRGVVCLLLHDDKGKCFLDPKTKNRAAREILYGDVDIYFDGNEAKYAQQIQYERDQGNVVEVM